MDAETDGLYGMFLSVAAISLDDDGNETDCFYGALRGIENKVTSEWVKANVLPFFYDTIRSDQDLYDNESDLIENFYSFYLSHKDSDVIADVPYPVEARLFMAAVSHDPVKREFEAPYPLMDLSSMIYMHGYPPGIDRNELVDCSDLRRHNAFDDVRMSIRVWKKLKEEKNE